MSNHDIYKNKNDDKVTLRDFMNHEVRISLAEWEIVDIRKKLDELNKKIDKR